MKKLSFKDIILLIVCAFVGVFFLTQELFSATSAITIFKSAYFYENEVVEGKKPTDIIVANGVKEITIDAGKNNSFPIEIKGDKSFNRNVCFKSTDDAIASVFYTGTESFYIVGKSVGECLIEFSSCLDEDITTSLKVNVANNAVKDVSSSYVYYQTIDGIIKYDTSFSVSASSSLNVGFVTKTSNGVFTNHETSYHYDEDCLSVDKYGNVSFKPNSYGKHLKISIVTDNKNRVEFDVHVKMPDSYSSSLSKQMFSIFMVYIFLFGILSFVTSYSLKRIVKHRFIIPVSLLIVSIIVLIIQMFALSRTFSFVYFIVSPLITFVVSSLVIYFESIKAFLKKILANFSN